MNTGYNPQFNNFNQMQTNQMGMMGGMTQQPNTYMTGMQGQFPTGYQNPGMMGMN